MVNSPVIHFAYEALQPQPDIPWIIQDFISAGCVSVLAGDGGSGKTYALLDAAVCVAKGKDWINSRQTTQTNVLFIDEESGLVRFNKRLAEVMNAHGAGVDLPLYYTNFAGFDLQKSTWLQRLEKVIKDTMAGLVILDALMDLMPGADENASKDMVPVLNGLKTIAEHTGAAICIIHHVNKNGGYRGSSAIKGVVDLLLLVEKKGTQITFKSTKSRDSEPFKFAVNAHFEVDKFYLSDAGASAVGGYQERLDGLSKAEKVILNYLAQNNATTKSELESLPGSAKRTLSDAIYSLVGQGYAERTNNGAQGTAAIYNLTNAGIEIAIFAHWINDPWIIADFAYVNI